MDELQELLWTAPHTLVILYDILPSLEGFSIENKTHPIGFIEITMLGLVDITLR